MLERGTGNQKRGTRNEEPGTGYTYKMPARIKAPELTGGLGWFNTDRPLELIDLRGKLVLLDFWTYCCINCMHVLSGLKRLEAKYPKQLVVIGVHSAKFPNEKISENIRQAILRYEIRHPVVNDADLRIWRSYTVRAWPTLVLIDPEGYILGAVSGEGDFDELERTISQLIDVYRRQGLLRESPAPGVVETPQEEVLSFPGKVLFDQESRLLFISDSNHNRILVARTDGEIVERIGGRQSAADGSFELTGFNRPQGVAFSGQSLFVADTENHLIRRCDLKRRTVTTTAGTGQQARQYVFPGRGRSIALNSPWDLCLIGKFLYIAMAGPHQIWRLDLETSGVSPYAGSGREGRLDGPLAAAALAQPSGLATDGKSLFVADSETSSIRSVSLDRAGGVETLVGVDLFEFGDIDGTSQTARLQHPLGVAFLDDLVYIADTYNHKIKVVDRGAATCVTLAGTGKPGDRDGRASEAQFYEPGGLSFSGRNLFVADTNNHRVRILNLDSLTVSTLSLRERKTAHAAATADRSDEMKDWLPVKEIRHAPLELKTSVAGAFHIQILLDGVLELSAEAPMTVRLKSTLLEWPAATRNTWTVEPPRTRFSIPFQTRDLASQEVVHLELIVSYCRKNLRLCEATTVRWSIPVRLNPTSENTSVELACELH